MACQKAAPYVAAARAKSTRRLYARALARWAAWCAVMHASPLPAAPEAVAAFLAELARDRQIRRHRQGRARRHPVLSIGRRAMRSSASTRAIAAVMAGIARRSSRPIRRAAALELEDLRSHRRAHRRRGFAGACATARSCSLASSARSGAQSSSPSTWMGAMSGGARSSRSAPRACSSTSPATKASAATQTVAIPRREDELCAAAAVERYLAVRGDHARAAVPRRQQRRGGCSSAGSMLQACATSSKHAPGSAAFSPHSLALRLHHQRGRRQRRPNTSSNVPAATSRSRSCAATFAPATRSIAPPATCDLCLALSHAIPIFQA